MSIDLISFTDMDIINIPAPHIDNLINACQHYSEVKNDYNIEKLLSIFDLICRLEKQGDDEFRNIWITAERGKIEDFGDFDEYLEAGEVSDNESFEELWQYYYPDEIKWYNFAITKYAEVFYFYVDSKLTFQFKADGGSSELVYDFHTELIDCLLKNTEDTMQTSILINPRSL